MYPIGSCAERMLKPDVRGLYSDVSLSPGVTCEASNISPACRLLKSAIIARVTAVADNLRTLMSYRDLA